MVAIKCKQCGHRLANDLLPEHCQPQSDQPSRQCQLYFANEQIWMQDLIFFNDPTTCAQEQREEEERRRRMEGVLQCPKCRGKVGHWSWYGLKCTCGQWIAPAFAFTRSRVDPILAPPDPSLQ